MQQKNIQQIETEQQYSSANTQYKSTAAPPSFLLLLRRNIKIKRHLFLVRKTQSVIPLDLNNNCRHLFSGASVPRELAESGVADCVARGNPEVVLQSRGESRGRVGGVGYIGVTEG